MPGITTSQYLEASDEQYNEKFANKGSIYTQTLRDKQPDKYFGEENGEKTVRFERSRGYLKGLKFNFIKDRFLKLRGSSSVQR